MPEDEDSVAGQRSWSSHSFDFEREPEDDDSGWDGCEEDE